MSLFLLDPFQALNIGFETEPSRHVYLIRHPRKTRDCRHQQNEVQKREPVNTKDNFHVTIDVQQFTPEEILIKAVDTNTIIVEAKHEEKEDEHGSVYRHFVRKYVVGEEYDMENIESRLSTDGVLSITAPKIMDRGQSCGVIPIIETDKFENTQVKAEEEKKLDVENGQKLK